MIPEPELEPDHRAALLRWASCDVPDDFADRVAERHTDATGDALGHRARPQVAAPPDTWAAWWIGMIAAAAAVLLALTLLARDSAELGATPGDDRLALREAAGALLVRECTPCHIGSSPQSVPAAIAVFDLDEPQWDQRMSADQLTVAMSRIADRSDAAERGGFRRYVEAELAHRGTGVR